MKNWLSFSKVKEVLIEKGLRSLKVEQFGVKTGDVVSDFGDDSHPLKDMIALYGRTTEDGENVIIGYLNENQLAAVGEKRIFSLKADGSKSFDVWLKNDGTLEMGGNAFTTVKYEPLDTSLKAQDGLINVELAKISAVLNSLVPGSYTPTPVMTNISPSQNMKIKTI